MTVADFKTRLAQKIHGQNLDKVPDVYGLIGEAAGNLLLHFDPLETRRVYALQNGLYDDVFRYAAPSDLKKDRIVSIRPQGATSYGNTFRMVLPDQFDRYKAIDAGTFCVESDGGTKTLRVSQSLTQGATLNESDSVTANGTWSASGDASGIATDTVNFVSGSGSVRFDLAASGSAGVVTNSTMAAVDLSGDQYGDAYSVLAYVYLPSAHATAMTLRWGSDASNYYSSTATAAQDGTALGAGWNLVRFDRASATVTLSPDDGAIDYLRLSIAYDGTAMPGVRIDNFVVRVATAYEVVYYSRYLFENASGTRIEIPTADTDVIQLDVDGVSCLLYEAARLAAQELQGEDGAVDLAVFQKDRDDVWKAYGIGTPSESKQRTVRYYRQR